MKIVLFLIPFLFLSHVYAGECSFPPRNIMESSVKVEVTHEGESGAYLASGVLLPNRNVLTNLHNIESLFRDSTGTTITIRPIFGDQTYKANLINFDSIHDIALLRVKGLKYPSTIELLEREVKENEVIWVLGYNLGRYLHVVNGQISNVYRSPYRDTYITDIRIETGYSGSGAFICEKGKYYLAGLVRAFLTDIAGNNLSSSVIITPVAIKKLLWK